MTYLFDTFTLDPDRRELRRDGQPILIEPQAFDLLEWPIKNKDRVVTKDELIAAIWSGRTISDSTLASCVNAVRTAIGDSGQTQTLLKTLPRKGFRFVGELQDEAGDVDPAAKQGSEVALRPLALPDKPSIAVLPFANLSSNADQDYFSDGVTDDIITELSRYPDLFVIARNSSFKFKGRSVDVRDVGRDFGVRYVLEGTVRKSGNLVRISAQLVDTDTGIQRWADRYDRSLDDVFAIQEEVANNIISIATAHIHRAERTRSSQKPTEIWDAYDYYLRASHMMSTFEQSWLLTDLEVAKTLVEQAIALDPASAMFHTLLAHIYHTLFAQPLTSSRFDPNVLDHALHASATAIQLNPNYASAHSKHALSLVLKREHNAALSELDKALQLNANLADHCGIAICAYSAECARGLDLAQRILRLDPFHSPLATMWAGVCHHLLEQYEQAEPLFLESVARAPGCRTAHLWLAVNYVRLNKLDHARHQAKEAWIINPLCTIGNSAVKACAFFRRTSDIDSLLEGLRLAGVPD